MDNITTGKRIKELREDKNLTHLELAEKLGYSKSIISFWENGKKQPNSLAIIALSKFFGVSADYLLGLENEDGTKNYTEDYTEVRAVARSKGNVEGVRIIKVSKSEEEMLEKFMEKIKGHTYDPNFVDPDIITKK